MNILTPYEILFAISVIVIVLWVCWRFASRRHSLPCPTWLGWLVEMDNPFCKVNRAVTIIQNTDLKKGMTVADVGCGPGRLSIPIAKTIGPQGTLVAMDIQSGMLSRVQEKARKENLTNIQFLHAGIGENKLQPNKFDRVFLVTVLGEIPHQEKALKEIFSALKPGGTLSVTEIIFDPHFQSQKTVRQLALSIGFKERNLFGNHLSYTLNFEKP